MKWIDYSRKHLDFINALLEEALLSLRKRKNSSAYKSGLNILCINAVMKSRIITHKDMLLALGRTFVWCNYFNEEIPDKPTSKKIALLGKQCKKQFKKNMSRYNQIFKE